VASPSVAPASPAASAGVTAKGGLSGRVFDHAFVPVPDGTTVTVVSLDRDVPFTASAATSGGAYVVNQVPFLTQLEVTATRPGWTSRRQVVVLRPLDPRTNARNELDFGGKNPANGGTAGAYFISPYPELSSVAPADQDASLPGDEMKFVLTLSEPLDAENQRRLASAFRIVPNSLEAVGVGQAVADALAGEEVEGLRVATAVGDIDDEVPYAFRQNSAFMGGLETSTFAWSEGGRKASFTLKAPVKTGRDTGAEYAFLLVQPGAAAIEDAEGLPLGMDEDGEWGQAREGELLYNVVAEAGLTLGEGETTGKGRWADTHQTFTRLTFSVDDTRPRLKGVLARRNYLDTEGDAVDRLELTYSEPMMAYPRLVGSGVLRLDNYLIATAAKEDGLAELPGLRLAEGVSGLAGTAAASVVRAALDGNAVVRVEASTALAGRFGLTFSVRDPAVVVLNLPAGSLPDQHAYIGVRAGARAEGSSDALADPAGNVLRAAEGVAVGPIQ
jgi:hypothetical protein